MMEELKINFFVIFCILSIAVFSSFALQEDIEGDNGENKAVKPKIKSGPNTPNGPKNSKREYADDYNKLFATNFGSRSLGNAGGYYPIYNQGNKKPIDKGIGFGKKKSGGENATTVKKAEGAGEGSNAPTWRPPKKLEFLDRDEFKEFYPNSIEDKLARKDNNYFWDDAYYDDYKFESKRNIRIYGTFEDHMKQFQKGAIKLYRKFGKRKELLSKTGTTTPKTAPRDNFYGDY